MIPQIANTTAIIARSPIQYMNTPRISILLLFGNFTFFFKGIYPFCH
jgi:hypothetical protein